jgi:tetratricopeptide (TPR) repeat protein
MTLSLLDGRPRWIAARRAVVVLAVLLSGCGPSYRQLRIEGQQTFLQGSPASAAVFFEQAEAKQPRQVENLHDLGACRVLQARAKFKQLNHAAAMREVDDAIRYYSLAIQVHPGHEASIEGKNIALELKGQFEEALRQAEWTAEFVGPSAKQYLYLARELQERGDKDGAFLRYRQAVAMEPRNAMAHKEFAGFLLRSNNEPAAIHHLQAAYRLDPRDEWVASMLTERGALPDSREPAVPASDRP